MPKSQTTNPESEWFGFSPVKPQEKTGMVQEVFSSVAGNYDLMNDLMSGGLHRLWKDKLVSLMNPQAGQTLLDVAGGTGDVALRCYKRTEGQAKIIVCDLNPAMLQQGRAKMVDEGILPHAPHHEMGASLPLAGGTEGGRVKLTTKFDKPSPNPSRKREGDSSGTTASNLSKLHDISFITGNAEELPIPSRSIDTYAIAFGLRNVTHIDKALKEAARVLRPGGRFFCMEFSPGVLPALKPIYDRYCMKMLPWLGQHIANDRDAYQYLAESIMKFPLQLELAERMEKAGLQKARWLNLTGGIAVIHSGWRV